MAISAKKVLKVLSILLGLVVLAGIVYGLFVVAVPGARTLSSLNPDVTVAIIAAVVSVLSIVLARAYETRAAIQKDLRDKKIPVYEDLIAFMFKILMSSKTAKAVSENEMIEFMSSFTQRIMVWGSDDVTVRWVTFRRISLNADVVKAEPAKLMLAYEDVILAIRRDLGHSNRGLARGDVLSLFVNDVDSVLGKPTIGCGGDLKAGGMPSPQA